MSHLYFVQVQQTMKYERKKTKAGMIRYIILSQLYLISFYLLKMNMNQIDFKVFKAISYNFSEKMSWGIKLCCINIHLAVDPLTFRKYCIMQFIVFNCHHQNETLYNNVLFGINFTNLLKIPRTHRIHPNAN